MLFGMKQLTGRATVYIFDMQAIRNTKDPEITKLIVLNMEWSTQT